MSRTELGSLVVAVLLVVALVATPVAAADSDDEDDLLDELFADGSEAGDRQNVTGVLEAFDQVPNIDVARVKGTVIGIQNRLLETQNALFGDEQATNATAVREQVLTEVNRNASLYQSYLNDRINASTSADVLAVQLAAESSNATLYLTADVANGQYRNLTATTSTSRNVDESCTIRDDAVDDVDDELATFREQFVVPNETVREDGRYIGRMSSQYMGDVTCTFLGGDD